MIFLLFTGILAIAEEFGIGRDLGRPLSTPDEFNSETGKGISCKIDDIRVDVGNRKSLESHDIKVREGTFDAMTFLEDKGQTAVVVSVNGETEAVIGLIDKARVEATGTIKTLIHKMGIDVYMLTGDNLRTARVVAREIGLENDENIFADVLPDGKKQCIETLQGRYNGKVAMVGDGVNDSPALAQAEVGIAIGAGANIAVEAASLVLMNSKVTDVVTAIDLTRKVYRRICVNFVWALGYNTLAIPVGAGFFYPLMDVVLPPWVAGLAMIFSSMTVLFSSLLLNAYRPPYIEAIPTNLRGNENIASFYAAPQKSVAAGVYPGCQNAWSQPCACGPICRCKGGCCSHG